MASDAANNYFPESDDYIYFFATLVCCLSVTILLIIQTKNVYSDLWTKERSSVAHRSVLPTITILYKSVNVMTCFSIFCYSMNGLLECLKQGHSRKCVIEFYIVVVFLVWSKSSIFTVYLLRIISTYGETSYAYPKWIMYVLIAIQWIIGLTLPIILNVFTEIFVFDEDGFPDPCWGVFTHWNALWLITWDFVMNFGSLIAFTVPLYKTLRHINRDKNSENRVHSSRQNMKRIAIKVSVLTAVSSLTTIIGLTAFAAFTFAHIFPFDWVVNSVCLMLMTPYYREEIYFHQLCGLCLKCCPSYTPNAETELAANSPPTSANHIDIEIIETIANDTLQLPPVRKL